MTRRWGNWQTALALSAVIRQEDNVNIDLDQIRIAITEHTVLQLAGLQFPERLRVLEHRFQQLGGMIELARRLRLETRFIRALEGHRQVLIEEIEGP